MLLALLAGCGQIELPRLILPVTATPPPGLGVFPTVTTTPRDATPVEQQPTAAAAPLTIWLPAQLDPQADTVAGRLLRDRLQAFQKENPGLPVQVRLKAQTGPGSLLESLTATSAAAPAAMPSLVALSRSDLETAALKGLVVPLQGLSSILEDADWYPYAQQLGEVQGTGFGIPFGGDALVLVYHPARFGQAPADWNGILKLSQPVIFPSADPQALLTLSLYTSLGGVFEDEQRRPTLQPDVLAKALKLYADGAQPGVFPYWISQIQTDAQAWQAYKDQRGLWLVTWSSQYFAQSPSDSAVAPLPSLADKPLTMASGWVWAVSDPDPARRKAAAQLAEYLVNRDFLGNWETALGMLPTRPSALSAWTDANQRALLGQVVFSAQVRPSNDLMASLGPALEGATLQVIKREADPGQAAQAAAERLAIPKTK